MCVDAFCRGKKRYEGNRDLFETERKPKQIVWHLVRLEYLTDTTGPFPNGKTAEQQETQLQSSPGITRRQPRTTKTHTKQNEHTTSEQQRVLTMVLHTFDFVVDALTGSLRYLQENAWYIVMLLVVGYAAKTNCE